MLNKYYFIIFCCCFLGLSSNDLKIQTRLPFADAHYSGFASELIQNDFSKIPDNTIQELKDYFNIGGRLLGITFTIPDHKLGSEVNQYDSGLIKMYKIYLKMVKENDDFLCFFNNNNEFNLHKLNLFISIEGISEPILNSLLKLDTSGNLRIVGLIHNSNNEFGSSSSTSQNQQDLGLTEIGKSTIATLISKKIIIDISHFSSKSFWDAIDICNSLKGKLIASHTGISSINSHTRNLKNEQLESINRIGGGIGLIIHSPFIRANSQKGSTIEDYCEMLRYLQDNLNMQNVFIGSDYCQEIQSINGVASLADLPKEILRYYGNNLSDTEIQDFTINNLLKILIN